ncbi:similar to Saccharomyces cerevisiae YDR286C Putative protein of unknown function [Maudiozyma barnettii]|uniref:Glutaredoxin-like protein n=1 Tax=Maudiozyma barnettii TaxID=61262 RepID=A0A8H2ZHN2_9SACH|nr:Mgp12p [Kazachstania barnettii]CAB4254948.1 similar to Saccharomyces cerevisiae YDR286C Putative protein of unknown function [Kazachstania barnettii]CAD1783219.1 similar to Saccharomyces cerevisiae YDR286C Putative protein of unknown function [Kazachstania barnettii]
MCEAADYIDIFIEKKDVNLITMSVLRLRIQSVYRSLHISRRVCNYTNVKLTLFSKPQCGLCEEAHEVINDTLESPEFVKEPLIQNMEIININKDAKWWKEYCFDIPVLHIEKQGDPSSLVKIMHHFREDELTTALKKFK